MQAVRGQSRAETLARVRCLLQRPALWGVGAGSVKLCSVPRSEGTGGSNGKGELRRQTENGWPPWSSYSQETLVPAVSSLPVSQARRRGPYSLKECLKVVSLLPMPSQPWQPAPRRGVGGPPASAAAGVLCSRQHELKF